MKNKIDWINHLIAFLSALIGILIAFQLEDYQDRQQENEELQIALDAVKKEVENNIEIYQTNIEKLSDWMDYYNLYHLSLNEGNIEVNKIEFYNLMSKSPTSPDLYFASWNQKKMLNDSILLVEAVSDKFFIDVAPITGISSSSWQAGVYSGVLNRLNHNELSKLTNIYEWVQKDMRIDEASFYDNIVGGTSKFTNIDQMVQQYQQIIRVYQFKHQMVTSNYNKIRLNGSKRSTTNDMSACLKQPD